MNKVNIEELARTEGSSAFALTKSSRCISESVYENLPEPLNEICKNFEGRERDVVFLSSIGVISSCLPNVEGFYDRRMYNSNLYIFIIAPPASGKGVMNWSRKLVEPIHENLIKESRIKIKSFRESSNNENGEKPKVKIKIVPGNTSSAKFYTHLQESEESLIILESEADSLSNMLKQDWGNFSDLLRKGFHHETVSISRAIEDRFFEIKNPKLSIVLSGTPNQVRPLVESKENGLFSRFIYYYFEDVSGWKDVSPNGNVNSFEELFVKKAKEIGSLYDKLKEYKRVEVKMSPSHWTIFQLKMKSFDDTIMKTGKRGFVPVVRRLGVIAFRMIMIFTVLENRNRILDNENELVLTTSDKTLKLVLEVVDVLIDHSISVFDKFDKKSIQLDMQERILMADLPKKFKRRDGLEKAIKINIPERTYDSILKKLIKKKAIRKLHHGSYEKLI